jgi:hypothetical protein
MEAVALAIFLFLKTGEKFATQGMAGPTVSELTNYLGNHAGLKCEARVVNQPAAALEVCGKEKPPVGIVTPGFFLTYQKALAMEPVLEVRRENVAAERFVLVARKDASADPADWTGKTIATTLAAEERYVKGVILRDRFGSEIRLAAVGSAEDGVFDLVEGAKNAADGVLVEEAAWAMFAADPELGGQLKVVFQSEELPRDLVVKFGDFDAARVQAALVAMSEEEAGRKILSSIRVEKFEPINTLRLEQAQKLFHGK